MFGRKKRKKRARARNAAARNTAKNKTSNKTKQAPPPPPPNFDTKAVEKQIKGTFKKKGLGKLKLNAPKGTPKASPKKASPKKAITPKRTTPKRTTRNSRATRGLVNNARGRAMRSPKFRSRFGRRRR